MARAAAASGTGLGLAAGTVEEALLGRLPSLRELERAGVGTLAGPSPLLTQFLAWQRLVQLRRREEQQQQQGQQQQQQSEQGQGGGAAAALMGEIERVRAGAEARRRLAQQTLGRLAAARQWAGGRAALDDFLTAAT